MAPAAAPIAAPELAAELAPELPDAPQAAPQAHALPPQRYTDAQTLYLAYMPIFMEGGLFVPTPRDLRLGDRVALDLILPDSAEATRLSGTVAWITPAHAAAGKPRGVGVRFSRESTQTGLRQRIETLLGTLMASTLPTQTL